MRLGLALPTFGTDAGADAVIEVSRTAEDLGYDSLWTGDRILAPRSPSVPYPGKDPVMPRYYENFMDPLVSLTLAAAHTRRVRLGTSTLNALWHPPVMLARALTTLDVVSGGRLDVGLGLGWMPEEYTAVGVPWQGRGARLDETLDILEKYWTRDEFGHTGPLFTVPGTVVGLKPVQRPGPPVLLAAFTPGGIRRLARRAAGWLPVGMPLPHLTAMWTGILQEAEKAGRDPAELRMALRVNPTLTEAATAPEQMPSAGTLDQYIGYARAAAEAGVHELFVDLGQSPATFDQRIDIAGRFIEGVRAG
ncbi:probable F420-dependent oxidoreductase, Rv2161c family [Actinacidiphila yanglinensis]|uniref:Probable F420-dependent oxidoreductase, Rv2161c family n=1 Tax=Actinacidiphila yanglinensis TaxID=310779 RepID=A0A1H6E364_9ACTN|nr:TIGR03619 family F420-dependent LLM class oxidoreductase [Actinacidiphila yanglinensis]SEG92060.1 probable F420-dependent oxidoreductase, Rv2161c family [Actinacidiphila yanglinensis]